MNHFKVLADAQLVIQINSIEANDQGDMYLIKFTAWEGKYGGFPSEYLESGAESLPFLVDDFVVSFTGGIKADGCCNLFVESMHFCGKNQAASFGATMSQIYDFIGEFMPSCLS